MIFLGTELSGIVLIESERHVDERGFFARMWCRREFEAHGLNTSIVQCNVSFNQKAGTLRGMHYQVAPHAEAKVVRCTRGAIYDVVLDLRTDSATRGRWMAVELTADNQRMLYVPEGLAHGFQTLADDTEVLYQMSEFHAPAFARGVRWDDPAFAIRWPDVPRRIISQRDRAFPPWQAEAA